MKTNLFFKLLFFLLLGFGISYSQFPNTERFSFNAFNRISFEILSFPSNNPTKSKLMVNTRISLDFVTLTRDPDQSRDKFSGNVEIIVEIIDKDNNSVAREISQKEITLTESEKKDIKDKFQEVSFLFEVKPDDYKIYFEINDRESEKNLKQEIKHFVLKDFKVRKISDISFISPTKNLIDNIHLINRSGNIPFNENVSLFLQIPNLNQNDIITMEIFKIDFKGKQSFFKQDINNSFILKNYTIDQISKFVPEYSKKSNPDMNIIEFPLQSDTFDIGRYLAVMTLKSGLETDTVQKYFEVCWYNMPQSLTDFKLAQKKLQIITTKEEYNELTSGSTETQRTKFINFWKKKDPTPNTAYNEMMAEFYKRVDYATIFYSTVRDFDGSETDMGKIYILNGKPDSAERQLLPNTPPREVWIYKNLKKKFVFIDEARQGSFILSGIEDL